MANGNIRRYFRTPGGLIVLLEDWQLLLRNVKEGAHTLITGPSGSGKTQLAIEVAKALGRLFEVFYFCGVFDPEATIAGTTQLRAGETRYVRSRFVEAVTRRGCVIILDEINRAAGMVVNAVLSLLDWQGRFAVDLADGTQRLVELAPGVVILATANIGPEYVQTEPLDRALLDRLLTVRLEFPDEEEERELVEARGVRPPASGLLVRIAREVRKAHARGNLPVTISTRSLLEAAKLVSEGFSVERAFVAVVPTHDATGLAALRTIVRSTK